MSTTPPRSKSAPAAVFWGGANGSGKSSLRGRYDDSTIELHIDPDRIAKEINPNNPRSADREAGKQAIEFFNFAIENNIPFSMESTLTGRSILGRIQKAKDSGFDVELRYVGLDSEDLNVQRVAERVAKGGHHIDEALIRKRYHDSRANFADAAKLAHRVVVWDNSSAEPRLCATIQDGVLDVREGEPMPKWVAAILDQIGHGATPRSVDIDKLKMEQLPQGSFSEALKRLEPEKDDGLEP